MATDLLSYRLEEIKNKSADILKRATTDYEHIRAKDKEMKTSELKPGEILGFATYDGFYSSEMRDKCESNLQGYRAEIMTMLEEVKSEIKKKSSEPPTSDQANLLTALSVGKPNKIELQNALDENSGNYATFSAINRLATENGLHLETDGKNPLDSLLNTQTSLARDLNRLYTSNAEKTLSPAFSAFTDMMSNIFGE